MDDLTRKLFNADASKALTARWKSLEPSYPMFSLSRLLEDMMDKDDTLTPQCVALFNRLKDCGMPAKNMTNWTKNVFTPQKAKTLFPDFHKETDYYCHKY